MRIRLQDGLPYVSTKVTYQGQSLWLENALLDTGSAGVIVATDQALTIGLLYESDDVVHRIHGVGGAEFVYAKRVDELSVGELHVHDFEIEVGAMDYGFEIEGIIGMSFLIQVGAVIDLVQLEVRLSA